MRGGKEGRKQDSLKRETLNKNQGTNTDKRMREGKKDLRSEGEILAGSADRTWRRLMKRERERERERDGERGKMEKGKEQIRQTQ